MTGQPITVLAAPYEQATRSLRAHRDDGQDVLALAPRLLPAKATDAVLADNGPQSIEVVEGPYSQIVRILHDGALDVISARCGCRRLLMN